MKIIGHCVKCDRQVENLRVTYGHNHYRARRCWLVEGNCHGEADADTIFERDLQNLATDTVKVSLFGKKPDLNLTDEDIPF